MKRHLAVYRPARIALLAWGLAATGCASPAGKAPEAPAAGAPTEEAGDVDEDAATSIDGAAAELARAESQVLAALGTADGDRGHSLPPFAEPGEAPDGQPPPPAQAPAGREAYSATAADRCNVACRALESMQRAAERLCSIAGEDDARCQRADHRVSYATDLVRRSCASCS